MLVRFALSQALLVVVLLVVTDCDLTLLFYDTFLLNAPKHFAGKTVWITGASSGIGLELATQLSKAGAKLILSARREPELVKLQNALGGPAKGVHVLPLDLNDLDSLDAKASEALRLAGGDIDVLVNNGGQSQRAFALDTPRSAKMTLMNVDLFSAEILAEAMARHWQARGPAPGRSIVNIASLAGKLGSPMRTTYSAAKFGLIGYMDSLRAELRGVHVLNVCPGSVRTQIASNAVGADGKRFGVTDSNIANGQRVERNVALVISAVAAGLDEVWMFGSAAEKGGVYIAQYMPSTFRFVVGSLAHERLLKQAEAVLALSPAQ